MLPHRPEGLPPGRTAGDRTGTVPRAQTLLSTEKLEYAAAWSIPCRNRGGLPSSTSRPTSPQLHRALLAVALRGFVRCAACGSPLTASNSRGKMGRTYPYYRCWVKGCDAKVQIRAERLEEQFDQLLRRIELAPGMVRLVEATLLDI